MTEHRILAPLARWASRLAIFSAALIVIGVALHRLTSFPTPVAVNLLFVGFAFAGLAVLLALVALVQIWRRGYAGTASAALGIALPAVLAAWPLTFVPAYLRQAPLNDVTTDLANPPRFAALAKQRAGAAGSAAYQAQRFAELQQKTYPDLRTMIMERSSEEAFELVEEAVRKLRWRVASAEPPTARPLRPGILEATDQTLVLGFTDDIAIRVDGNASRSRIDVRSASRYGKRDLGQNANRVRRFFTELQARADANAPATVAGRRTLRPTRAGAKVKRPKDRDQGKGADRNARDRAQSSAQRARERKESLR
jgi:hypothetical protein